MRKERLSEMHKGWFVGNFEPTCYQTKSCEAACKHYRAGEFEEKHSHKIATEITLIVSGCARMNEQIYCDGDIIIIDPGDETDFYALEDTKTMVIKVPSVPDDKFIIK